MEETDYTELHWRRTIDLGVAIREFVPVPDRGTHLTFARNPTP